MFTREVTDSTVVHRKDDENIAEYHLRGHTQGKKKENFGYLRKNLFLTSLTLVLFVRFYFIFVYTVR